MKKLILLFLFGFQSYIVYNQQLELVSSAGDFFIYTNYSIAWSMGEPAIGSVNSESPIGSQSLHQVAIAEKDVTVNQGSTGLQLSITPNPSHDIVNLKIENYTKLANASLKCIGYSIIGEIVFEVELIAQETSIDISNLTPDVYLIRIFNPKQSLQLSKTIQKI